MLSIKAKDLGSLQTLGEWFSKSVACVCMLMLTALLMVVEGGSW